MDLIVQQLVNAVALCAIYALVAMGISLFFGVIGVVNLAHGDIGTVGVFAALTVLHLVPVDPGGGVSAFVSAGVALVCGVAASAVAGVLVYALALRPLASAPAIIGLLSSVGVGFVVREAIVNFYPNGRNPQSFPSLIPPTVYEVGGVFIDLTHVVLVIVAVTLVAALAYIVEQTRFGRATRSILNNREVALSLGVPVTRVTAMVFALGSGLAGIAALMSALYYNVVQSDMGMLLTVKGFTAAVIGGLGNIYGALLGAVLVGLIEAATAGFVPDGSAYRDVAVFATLIAMLILKPHGLLGRAGAERV
jgi:branched-chain amino acid transport system permease protein